MVDIKIHTDALIHKKDAGEIVHITIGQYKHNICSICGYVETYKIGAKDE